MNILAFDTSLEKMYVSLGDEFKVFGTKIIETTQSHYHSAFLISTIKNILKENKLFPQDVNFIATNIGPGSFTGIRACSTVARVFAQANNIEVVGVSSLEILSRCFEDSRLGLPAQEQEKSAKPVLVALDARKEMAYVAVFKDKKQILEPQAMLIEDLKKMLSEDDYFLITDDKLQGVLGGKTYQECSENLGEILIEIAKEKIKTGGDFHWNKLRSLYIQPPPVTVKKK